MPDIDKLLKRVLDAYAAAVYARDADKLIELYHPSVRVFDTWGNWSYEGAAAWHAALSAWLSSLGTERVKVSFTDVRSGGTPELAFASAIVTYAAVSADGEPLRAMQNRLSWVLQTTGHVLRIVHEHTSAPVGFDDMKAILQKQSAIAGGR